VWYLILLLWENDEERKKQYFNPRGDDYKLHKERNQTAAEVDPGIEISSVSTLNMNIEHELWTGWIDEILFTKEFIEIGSQFYLLGLVKVK